MNASSYNKLPSIEVANRLFINREQMLSKLAPMLQEYGKNKFGVCLVHRHCVLEEGERMVAEGNISEPVRDGNDAYPERWLASGEPYEFTRKPTSSPSQALLEKFRSIAGEVGVLGLFFIHEDEKRGVALERTEGRRNIVDIIPYHTPRSAITTAWHPRSITEEGYSVKLHECAACTVANNSHVENVNKMEGLERRTDLGLEIGWLNFDGGGEVHAT